MLHLQKMVLSGCAALYQVTVGRVAVLAGMCFAQLRVLNMYGRARCGVHHVVQHVWA